MTRLLVLFVPALLLMLAPPAGADTYTDNLVGHFGPTSHVWVDPGAKPQLQNADQLNQQILNTGKPIYIAAIPPQEVGIATPRALRDAWAKANGHFSGILVILGTNGPDPAAFDVPKAVADATRPAMRAALNAHRKEGPYAVMSAYVKTMSTDTPNVAAPAAQPAGPPIDGGKVAKWLFGILGTIIAVAGGIWTIISLKNWRQKRAADRARVEKMLIRGNADVNDLSNRVNIGSEPEVSMALTSATVSLADAQDAFDHKRYNVAEEHLHALKRAVARVDENATPDEEAIAEVPEDERKVASVQGTNSKGQTVTINNTDYRDQRAGDYRNYYRGGLYNGMYFPTGYYPYPINDYSWNLTNVLLMDELLSDHNRDTYVQNNYYDSPAGGPMSYSDSDDDNSDNWNQDTNWDSPSTPSEPSTPSYASSSSSSSSSDSDSGWSSSSSGGYDSGGGGGMDWGSSSGGGFDFGGGGGGFDSGGGGSVGGW
jgi:uncharacterized membrane protein YgcG